ncbi:hypothetical protein FRC07_014660 [Ceratobasidium sp. 392]|nr:hypothetical protein FRC07_014660 [Ceratobasidium sp. 392]
MFTCKFCHYSFYTTFGRTQHLRQKRACYHAYKLELAELVRRSRTWQPDDPDDMPSDVEGQSFGPEDEGLSTEGAAAEAGEAEDGQGSRNEQNPFYSTSLFEEYMSAIANKEAPINTEQADVGEECDDIPHAVPVVVDYYPNKHAGQPIYMSDEEDPQAYVTGNLANDANFEMADFVNSIGMTSSQRDTFFKLQLNQHLPWKNDAQYTEDMKRLPKGPEMRPFTVTVGEGDNAETVEMWCCDAVEVLKYLVGDPRFKEHIDYIPRKEYTDKARKNRVYSETNTGRWAWRMQCLIQDEFGTILSVMFMSDKTGLTTLSGGKEAWPVYATIGNITKAIRRQPSKHAVYLLGYLPIPSTLSKEADENSQGNIAWELFHKCLAVMVEPLITASENGVEMRCSDGGVRRCYPFLASYVADHPEQCLVACTTRCPMCEQTTDGWGDLDEPAPLRTKASTLRALEEAEVGIKVGVNSLGLRTVWPFWADLPFVNLATAITPDLLHQLHTGMFLDHLVPWCKELMGEGDMDRRFKAMTRYHDTRYFSRGISGVSQWTGREAKEMARVFLSVIDGAVPVKAVHAARALINFMFIAHTSSLTSLELREMDECLATFHANKEVFRKRKNGTVRNFNLIRKLHMLRHHTYSIRELGTPDGHNTETSERLHIPYAKEPYRASNKVDPTEQMAKYVVLRDAVARRRHYLQTNNRVHLVFRRSQAEERKKDTRGDIEEEKEGNDVDGAVVGGERSLQGAYRCIPKIPDRPFEPQPEIELANRSTWRLKAVSAIIDTHEAFDLISATNEFLDRIPLSGRPPLTRSRVSEHHLVPCWSQFTLRHGRLPFKPSEPAKSNIVRAAPGSFKNGKQTRPTLFDTVLVPCNADNIGLTRYRAARVRAIFQLPLHIRHLYPNTLVYLELFTRFTRAANSPSGFYRTSPAFQGGRRQVAVMPLSAVRMSCQLVPNFQTLRPGLSFTASLDTLDSFQEFGFNPHADYFLFAVMQHWEQYAASHSA